MRARRRESCVARKRAESRWRCQHSAGKDVLLDEIGLASVARELLVCDRDGLHDGAAFCGERRANRAEPRRPPRLADRFEHLDRRHAVVRAAVVAIILDAERYAIGEAGTRDALARVSGLRVGERERGDAITRAPWELGEGGAR